jgi:hypothetical protein
MTKNPDAPCNARKRLAFSLWLDVMLPLLARLLRQIQLKWRFCHRMAGIVLVDNMTFQQVASKLRYLAEQLILSGQRNQAQLITHLI